MFDTSVVVLGLSVNPSNSRLLLDLAKAGALQQIGIPQLVLEETSTVMERLYGRRAAFAARTFLLRVGTLIPRDERLLREIERARGLVAEKDLEIVAAIRVFNAERLVAYDRHFNRLDEYRTPKQMVEEFGVRPYTTPY